MMLITGIESYRKYTKLEEDARFGEKMAVKIGIYTKKINASMSKNDEDVAHNHGQSLNTN